MAGFDRDLNKKHTDSKRPSNINGAGQTRILFLSRKTFLDKDTHIIIYAVVYLEKTTLLNFIEMVMPSQSMSYFIKLIF